MYEKICFISDLFNKHYLTVAWNIIQALDTSIVKESKSRNNKKDISTYHAYDSYSIYMVKKTINTKK